MATYALNTFNATKYAAFRPHYPQKLFEIIFKYHSNGTLPNGKINKLPGRTDLAVDLGCGTGQATTVLTQFKRVIGVDPSQKMLQGAMAYAASQNVESTEFEFVQSPAEDLSFLKNNSVDLVIAAQAGHWFDWNKVWPEVGRVLKPGGSAAFWIYSDFRLPDYPSLSPLITEYVQGTNPETSVGPYWQRPGRTILNRHLVDIPEPQQVLNEQGTFNSILHRLYFTGPYYTNELPQTSTFPIISKTRTTWRGHLDYLYTWSAFHTYQEKHPEDKALSLDQGGEGNIADRFWKALKAGAEKESGKPQLDDDVLNVDWPIALIMTHKAA